MTLALFTDQSHLKIFALWSHNITAPCRRSPIPPRLRTPLNSNQNDKILYSQQRHSFKESLHGTVHHNVSTKKEIEKAILQAEGKGGDDSDNDD